MTIKVTYMSGAGNLFTVIDGRDYQSFSLNWADLSSRLCNLNLDKSKQTEGLIIVKQGINNLDFTVDFYNPDGSFGMMCGNGGRCAVNFAKVSGFFDSKLKNVEFAMAGTIYKTLILENEISLSLPKPNSIKEFIEIEIDSKMYLGTYINVGSDHFILDFETNFPDQDFTTFNLENFGPKVRFHHRFSPNGVNCNIYQRISDNEFLIRTYERGVEAETGACGTGTISTALNEWMKSKSILPYKFIPTSNIPLKVDFLFDEEKGIKGFILTGSAEIIGIDEFEV